MDSLTQIVLGAAVGEAALGKKIGNRAILWGAIAGTIPDLDVIGNAFLDPLSALCSHRGISHSIFFAVFFSFVMAKYTEWFYKRGHHKKRWAKILNIVVTIGFLVLIGVGLTFINNYLSNIVGAIASGIISLSVIVLAAYLLINKYYKVEQKDIDLSWKSWYLLFFFSIFTHPILDAFTVYGTQLLQPFSDYRVAWNSISIVDPVYTLPFLLCVLASAFMMRKSPYRRIVNGLGLFISTAYLAFTLWNKSKANEVLEDTLSNEGIEYSRYMTNPTFGNNTLWSATVDSDSVYHIGMYSFNDKEKTFKLSAVEKNHHLAAKNDKSLARLRWFSKDYYTLFKASEDSLYYVDMRYELRDSIDARSAIFGFLLVKDEAGNYEMKKEIHPDRDGDSAKSQFRELITRMKGI